MVSNPQMIGQADPASADDANDAPAIAQAAATAATSTPAPLDAESPVRLDPTRYGDWERNGRCIDF